MPGFKPCCEEMKEALNWNLLKEMNGEIVIVGKLPKGAQTGNVLTGEAYDARSFRVGLSFRSCPWCSSALPQILEEEEEPLGEPDFYVGSEVADMDDPEEQRKAIERYREKAEKERGL